MAKYDANKIYSELSKLSPREQAIQLSNIKDFVLKNLDAELEEENAMHQEKLEMIQNSIQTIK